MKVLDDGCICEHCPHPEEDKKRCPYFLFTTGIQRAAEAMPSVWPGYAIRVEMVECSLVADAEQNVKAMEFAKEYAANKAKEAEGKGNQKLVEQLNEVREGLKEADVEAVAIQKEFRKARRGMHV